MAAASNSILTSQAYKNLERSNLTMISTSGMTLNLSDFRVIPVRVRRLDHKKISIITETIVINKQYVKTVEEQIRPKIQDLEDHLVCKLFHTSIPFLKFELSKDSD